MNNIKGHAVPEYPGKESGILVVLGSAPCLYDDINKVSAALYKKPFSVMAINEAAGALEVDHIATMHGEKMKEFKALQLSIKTTDRPLKTHAVADLESPDQEVDYLWYGAMSAASSAFSGVKIGLMMGYDEIILCGCPMNGGDGYFNDTEKGSPSSPRLGYSSPEKGFIKSYKETVELYAKEFGDQVFSMSGHTGQILGVPSWLQH